MRLHKLDQICDLKRGTAISQKSVLSGNVPVVAAGREPAYFHNASNREGNIITVSGSGAYAGYINYFTSPIFASDCFTIKPKNENEVCAKYLFFWLKAKQDYFYSLQTGAGQPHVYPKDLATLIIHLPTLEEQKRIAAILDAADAMRAKRRESIALLDELLQSTFLDMFGDPAMNPMEFPIKALAEFYVSRRDGTKCGPFGSALKKNELVSSGVPVWNMDNINPSGRAVLPFRMWITEDKFRELEAYSVFDGDVIISRAGTVGKMCVVNTDSVASIISTNLIRVRFGPNLLPIYFVSLMNYCKGCIGRLKTGPDGAFTHMNTGILDKLKIPYPPLQLQYRFAAIVESVERQKALQRTHLAELDTLFATLQQRAFNGKLST